jgi:hypothetical protein
MVLPPRRICWLFHNDPPHRYIKGYARIIVTFGAGKLKAGENILLTFVELHAGGKTLIPVFMLNNIPRSFAAIVLARQKKIFFLDQEIG